eukprot:TRINITY_DN76093_c0_g1_i1.p1 TRINITY_DN76093_c0_g1~~TRINITY_DN76093_c0_g1_i1.p1  ORF type:complete len:300 (+),score=26.24 TRINITY_DN76093_c0_g1_i1:50-949(+)
MVSTNVHYAIAHALMVLFGSCVTVATLHLLPPSLVVRPLLAVLLAMILAVGAPALYGALFRTNIYCWCGLLPLLGTIAWFVVYTIEADPELGYCVCAPFCCCGRKIGIVVLFCLWTAWQIKMGLRSKSVSAQRAESDCKGSVKYQFLHVASITFGMLPVWGSMRAVALMGPLDIVGDVFALVGLVAGSFAEQRLARQSTSGEANEPITTLACNRNALMLDAQLIKREAIVATLGDISFWFGMTLCCLNATAATESNRIAGGQWNNWWLAAVGLPLYIIFTCSHFAMFSNIKDFKSASPS